MPNLHHQWRTGHVVLLIALLVVFGGLLWETFMAGPQMHKLEQFSENHYRAAAWSRDGLQVQLARHDPTNQLNSWLSALDIRNKTGGFVVDVCGLRAWKYETNGLAVSIFQIPLWAILTLAIAGYFHWRRRRVQAPAGICSVSECHHDRLTC